MAKTKDDQTSGDADNRPAATGEAPRTLTKGKIVYITDREGGGIHPAIATHVNEDQSAVVTVFKPHETVVGVGYASAVGNLASPGCWHWPM